MTNVFSVSRLVYGGLPGRGHQVLWQTAVVAGATPSVPTPTGTMRLVATNTVTGTYPYQMDPALTSLPVSVTDNYGGFPH